MLLLLHLLGIINIPYSVIKRNYDRFLQRDPDLTFNFFRELAEQISEVAKIFTEETGFGLLLLIGGTDVTEDVKSYRETGANIVVATPGRLDDFVTRINDIKFKTLEVLILDEADR